LLAHPLKNQSRKESPKNVAKTEIHRLGIFRLRNRFRPKIFFISSAPIPSNFYIAQWPPKTEPNSKFIGLAIDWKRDRNIFISIVCPSDQKSIAQGASPNGAQTEIHRLCIFRLRNRCRPKIFFISSAPIPSNFYVARWPPKTEPNSKFIGLAIDWEQDQNIFISLACPSDQKSIAQGNYQNIPKTEIHRLCIFRLRYRCRPKIFFMSSAPIPRDFYIAQWPSKAEPNSKSIGLAIDQGKDQNIFIAIVRPSDRKSIAQGASKKGTKTEIHRLGIFRLRNRCRSKIFLISSAPIPRNFYIAKWPSKKEPNSKFNGSAIDWEIDQNIFISIVCPSNQKSIAQGSSQNGAKTEIHRLGIFRLRNRCRPKIFFISSASIPSNSYIARWSSKTELNSKFIGSAIDWEIDQNIFISIVCPSNKKSIAQGSSKNGAKTEIHRLCIFRLRNRCRPRLFFISSASIPSNSYIARWSSKTEPNSEFNGSAIDWEIDQNIFISTVCPSNKKSVAQGSSQNGIKTEIHRLGIFRLRNRCRPRIFFISSASIPSNFYIAQWPSKTEPNSEFNGSAIDWEIDQNIFISTVCPSNKKAIAQGSSQLIF